MSEPRKLPHQLGEGDVYARDLSNDQVLDIEELRDELEEIERTSRDLTKQIEESDSPETRKELRAKRRESSKEAIALQEKLLGRVICRQDGGDVPEEAVKAASARVQQELLEALNEAPGERPDPQAGEPATTA